MPKVSQDYLAAKQEQILEAAVRRFARSGFHATGMAEVIREAGLSAGSVYRYYRSKDDLIAAIVGRMLDELQAQIVQATVEAQTPGEAVTACIRCAAAYLEQDKTGLSRVLPQVWTEALRSPEILKVVRAKYGAIIGHFEGLICQMQAEGTLRGDFNPLGMAHLMLSTLQGYILQKLLLGQAFSDEAYLATAEVLLAGEPDLPRVPHAFSCT